MFMRETNVYLNRSFNSYKGTIVIKIKNIFLEVTEASIPIKEQLLFFRVLELGEDYRFNSYKGTIVIRFF